MPYILIISLILAIVLIYFVWHFTRLNFTKIIEEQEKNIQFAREELKEKKEESQLLNSKFIDLNKEIAALKSEKQYLEKKILEQKEEMHQLHERMKLEFKNLANNILEEKTQKFTTQNKTSLEEILKPLGEKIIEFQKQVEQTNKEDISRIASLKTEIQKINESSIQISKDAQGLTTALKGDNKMQGNWGEFILESILEKSGLIKDQEYLVQKSIQEADTNKIYRPDIIIKLPDNNNIILDSKVSLNDYVQYINSNDENEKNIFLQKHLTSIKNHLKGLGDKKYHLMYNLPSLDFVIMFIPIEPAFGLALQNDINLFNKALEKNIVLTCPSTLMATLKTIKFTWKTEYQTQNVQEIARQGGALYDKFVGFIDDLIKIGKQIEGTYRIYQSASKKLYEGKDNLVKKTERLKELGANTSKTIPPLLLEKA